VKVTKPRKKEKKEKEREIECGPGGPEGHSPGGDCAGLCIAGLVEIMEACGLSAWQGWEVGPAERRSCRAVECGPGGAVEQGWRIRDPTACEAVAPWASGMDLGIQHWLFC
jgi:hypothetical protein